MVSIARCEAIDRDDNFTKALKQIMFEEETKFKIDFEVEMKFKMDSPPSSSNN